MFEKYHDFEIRIDADGAGGYSVSIRSPGGEAHAGLVLPSQSPDYAQISERLAAFDTDEELLERLGDRLFLSLFSGSLKDVYARSQGMLAADEGMRLRFDIAEAAGEAAALPWELLRDPDRGPLALLDSPIVRYLQHSSAVPQLVLPLPLKVLLSAASSSDQPDSDARRELAAVQAVLAELGAQVSVIVEPQLTFAALQQRLREHIHVWHFVGAGGMPRDGLAGHLLFASAGGGVAPVSATELGVLLNRSGVQLAVLSAGESASGQLNGARSVAPALIKAQLPAVVAMRSAVQADVTRAFAAEFYRTLVEGFPIDACVTEGRKAVLQVTGLARPDWGIPVVYTRAPSGRLFFRKSELPPATRLPDISGFVGREQELAVLAEKLAGEHLIVISGMFGVGKTMLGAALAIRSVGVDRVFWYTFHKGETIDAVAWTLAGFLARNGRVDIWQMLQSARQNSSQPAPKELLISSLIQELHDVDCMICLDDTDLAADDALIRQFVQQLSLAAPGSKFAALIIVSDTLDLLEPAYYIAVEGLSLVDSQNLVSRSGLPLSDELMEALYGATGGNATLLTLAIDVLVRTDEPAHLIERLDDTDAIEQFLNKAVYDCLDQEERAVMQAVSILRGHTGTRAAIEAVLDRGSIKRTLSELRARHLLVTTDDGVEKRYKQHGIVQAYYYDMSRRADRLAMHRRAGEFYEQQEPDVLRAASHFSRAEEYLRAADLATVGVQALVNQGMAQPLRQLLEQLTPQRVGPTRWVAVALAQSRIYRALQLRDQAQQSCQAVLKALEALPETPDTHRYHARAYTELGLLARRKRPHEALQSFHLGLKSLAKLSEPQPAEQAILLMNIGVTLIDIGKYRPAERALQRGLQLLPEQSQRRGTVLMNLGTIYLYGGDFRRAKASYTEALATYEQLHSDWWYATVRNNLGLVMISIGDWAQAAAEFQVAFGHAQRLGDIEGQILARLNAGNLLVRQGDFAAAESAFAWCRELAQRHELNEYTVAIQSTQADLAVRRHDWDAAEQLLIETEPVAIDVDTKDTLPEIYRSWAQVRLARGSLEQALELAERAIAAARELDNPCEIGIGLRVQGQLLASAGQQHSAEQAFEQSLALLLDRDRYEAARTSAQQGRMLLALGQSEPARTMFEQPRAVFTQLGARHDLDLLPGAEDIE